MAWKPRIRSEELAAYANALGSAQRGYSEVADELERGRTATHERRSVVDATYRSSAKPLLMDHYRAIVGDGGRVMNATRRIASLLGQARAEAHQASQQLGGIEIVLRKLDAQLADRQREVDRVSWAAKIHVPVAHEHASVVDQLRSEVRRAQGARDAVRRQRDAFRTDHDDRCKAAEARFGGLDGEIKAESKHIERTSTRLIAERREWSASPVHLQHKQLWNDSGLDRLVDAAAGGGVLSAEMIAYLRTPDGAAAGAMFADLYPEIAGNLNGLPAKLRDHANRIMLDRAIDATTGTERNRLEQLRESLVRFSATYPDLLLLKWDPNGDGRIVVAIGDPDTADNVAVSVPGVDTDTRDINGSLANAGSLRREMNAQSGGQRNCAIFYLDYDPPEAFKRPNPESSITTWGVNERADTLAKTLPDFLGGLTAQNPDARITLIGHSFGSLAIAKLARSTELPVDSIMMIGNPGVGKSGDTAADLRIRSGGQVWAAAATDDPVVAVRPYSLLPGDVNATDASFGAKGFGTGTARGHSEYFGIPDGTGTGNTANDSLTNIALIAVGGDPS